MVTLKDFFSFQKNRFFWINLIAMIVVIIAVCWGTLYGLDIYTHHGESYVVPNVKNKSMLEAEKSLNAQQQKAIIVDSSYVKGMPAGMVLEQTPVGGSRVKEGRAVYLTVTTSDVPLVKLPDLIDNSSLRQAAAKLKSIGFRLTEPEYIAGEQDWVYGIKYRGRALQTGDKVPHEALLTLCVGNKKLQDSLAVDSFSIQTEMNTEEDQPQVDDSWF